MKEPDFSEAKKRLNQAYDLATTQRDREGALRICDEVLNEYPGLVAAVRTKAAIHGYTKNFTEAIALMGDVIAHEPNDPGHYFSRGRYYIDNCDWDHGVADMTKTLQLDSEQNSYYFTETAYFFRAVALLKLRRYSDAVADCEHVRDDFLTYLFSTGKISKSDILEEAKGTN